jgi:cytochrome P450
MGTRALPPDPGFGRLAVVRRYRADPIAMLAETFRLCGDIATFRIGPQRVYAINHPDLVADTLVTQARAFHKGRILHGARALLGEGLLTSEDDTHLRQRRLIQPAFHRRRVETYATAMVVCAESFRESWRSGDTVDMAAEMQRLTLSVVTATLFGGDLSEPEANAVAADLSTAMVIFDLLSLPFGERLLRLPLPSVRRFRKARDRLDATVLRLVDARRAAPLERSDLLSLLLAARDADDGSAMSDAQLRDEAVSLFLAGHETTANVLSWAWYLLSAHPEPERRLHAELDTVLDGRVATADDAPKLAYCGQVIDETLRLYPPGWALPRLAVSPVEIGGYEIAAGDVVVICLPLLHRDPRFWTNPEEFDPDRFAPGTGGDRPRHSYLPFAAGPRMCLGQSFALIEARLLLATLAQRFRPRLVAGTAVAPHARFTLRPRGGLPMTLENRWP